MNIETARFNMIEQQIRPWYVGDTSVLALLSEVKREDFVPASHRGMAFADLEVPLQGSGEAALAKGECMLYPRVEARILQDLAIQPTDTVLEIGAGSGYMAALLAKKALRVVSVEINPTLAALARDNLRNAGIQNAEVRQADGAQLGVTDGSFDVIVLSGSVSDVPANLLQMLKAGGRLAGIVGEDPVMRCTIVTKTADSQFHSVQSWDTLAPRLQNFPEASRFKF